MSFFVLLPSDSSMDLYPNNTQSNYTTVFNTPIVLNGEYEVGIVQLTYASNIKVRTIIPVDFNNPNSAKYFIDVTDFTESTTNQEVTDVVINEHKKHFGRDFENVIRTRLRAEFTYATKNLKIYDTNLKLFDYTPPPPSNTVMGFIYCDCIDNQYVGNSLVPCLKTVILRVGNSTFADNMYETPHYVKVNKDIIHSINIAIRDTTSEFVNFQNKLNKTIVKLHFRKIK